MTDLPAENFISNIIMTERTITNAGLAHSSAKILPANSVVVSSRATIGRIGINRIPLATNQGFKSIVIEDTHRVMAEYVALALTRLVPEMQAQASGATYKEITKTKFAELEILLPPLEVQRELVAEIKGYQRVIDGVRAVVENWRPRIDVDPEWPLVEIGDICNLVNGRAFKPSEWTNADSNGLPIVRIQNLNSEKSSFNYYIGKVQDRYIIGHGELLFSWSGSRGTSFGAHIWSGGNAILNQHIFKVEFDQKVVKKAYLYNALNRAVAEVEQNLHGGVGLVHITKGNLERIRIPLPPVASQEDIIVEVEGERTTVAANRKLAARMEQRIHDAIARVWEG